MGVWFSFTYFWAGIIPAGVICLIVYTVDALAMFLVLRRCRLSTRKGSLNNSVFLPKAKTLIYISDVEKINR